MDQYATPISDAEKIRRAETMQMLAKRRAKRAGNAAGKKRAVLYVSLFIVALVGILAGRFFLQWNEDRQTERRVNQKMDSVLGH